MRVIRRKRGKTSTPKKPKKSLVYEGVKFRSPLEIFCYKELQNAGVWFEYEKQRFVLQESFTNPNISYQRKGVIKKNRILELKETSKIQAISYLPDFVGSCWVLEIKGELTEASSLRIKMLKRKLYEEDRRLAFIMCHNQSEVLRAIELIKTLTK